MVPDALHDTGVLVTRPAHQAQGLCDAIESQGGAAILFPVIEIVPRDSVDIVRNLDNLGDPDISIFVSANAVRYGFKYAGDATIAAVGPTTAAAIEKAGGRVDILSEGFDSEQLLTMDELQDVGGKVVRIVRGNAGRELLADTLRGRGASVEYLEVYSRTPPQYDDTDLAQLEKLWRDGKVNIVTVMSVASLRNLVRLLPEWCLTALQSTPLVTPAKRVIKEAGQRFPGIPTTLANGPQARDMLDAIVACHRSGPE